MAPGTQAPDAIRPRLLRELVRGVAGPVIGALVLIGLLSAWVITGGAGTITRVRLQVTLAAVPMRSLTPQAAAAVSTATTFLTIRNLSGTADELIAVRSPLARRVVLTQTDGPEAAPTVVAGLAIPPHGTLTLTPFGDDVVLQHPASFETRPSVPLTLTFRHAGTVTIQAAVTAPGTP
jgi:copper(I)-binding protein